MKKLFMLLLCIIVFSANTISQTNYELKGRVVDQNNDILPGATVFLDPIKKGTITDDWGHFRLKNLSKGIYKIEISFIGYQTLNDTIVLNGNSEYKAMLEVKSENLQEIVVSENYAFARKKEEALNIEIVDENYLMQNMGGSLMNSLEKLAGVTSIDIGSGLSKPVIRGLGFNRVVVIENNIKHEAQQWGADHGLEIDQYAIDNIEVIKGPASLMYGSDAIGGIIDINNRKIPADSTIGGTFDISAKSNNQFVGTSVSLYGRKKWFFAQTRATLVSYGDYKVPADSVDIYSFRAPLFENHLRNTAGNELNLHANFGLIFKNFQSRVFISSVNSKSGFFANAHGLEPRNVDTKLHDQSSRDIQYPYQLVNHFKITNSMLLKSKMLIIENDMGFQRNFRQEWSMYVNHGYMPAIFPDSLGFDANLERQFEKFVYSENFKISNLPDKKVHLSFGFSGEYLQNQINGRGFIIPDYSQLNLGSFAIAKLTFSNVSLVQLGIRYDYAQINSSEFKDWFASPIISNGDTSMQYLLRAKELHLQFSNFSYSLGYNFHPGDWVYKVNVGKSFRVPLAKELAANGVNYHHFSYEVGNAELSPEIAYQLDAGIEHQSIKLLLGISPFLNYFSNYIYLNPSSEHDRLYGNGNQVFYYTQSKVLRYGAELNIQYQLFDFMQLGIVAEYVYSEQLSGEKKGFSLPFSPPASAIFNIRIHKPKPAFGQNVYFTIDYKITAAQIHIVPPEETSDAYSLFNLGIGGDILRKKQKVSISFQVQNLLNNKYFNHTSYYRLINVPEAGRNAIVNISIPFSKKLD